MGDLYSGVGSMEEPSGDILAYFRDKVVPEFLLFLRFCSIGGRI